MRSVDHLLIISLLAQLLGAATSISITHFIPKDTLDQKEVVHDEDLSSSLEDQPVQSYCYYVGRLIVGVEPPALPQLHYQCPETAFTGGACWFDDVPAQYTGTLVNGSIDHSHHDGKIVVCADHKYVPDRVNETCSWIMENYLFHCGPKGMPSYHVNVQMSNEMVNVGTFNLETDLYPHIDNFAFGGLYSSKFVNHVDRCIGNHDENDNEDPSDKSKGNNDALVMIEGVSGDLMYGDHKLFLNAEQVNQWLKAAMRLAIEHMANTTLTWAYTDCHDSIMSGNPKGMPCTSGYMPCPLAVKYGCGYSNRLTGEMTTACPDTPECRQIGPCMRRKTAYIFPAQIVAQVYDRGTEQTSSMTISWDAKKHDSGCGFLIRSFSAVMPFMGLMQSFVTPIFLGTVLTLACSSKIAQAPHHGFYY